MKNFVLAFAFVIGCTLISAKISAQTISEFKGATYVCFIEGEFDGNPQFAMGFKLSFNRLGNVGVARGMSADTPEQKNAVQDSSIFTCGVMQDGTKFFGAKNMQGGDQALFFYKVYDNGARVWIEHSIPGRRINGWMFRVPAKATDANFPK